MDRNQAWASNRPAFICTQHRRVGRHWFAYTVKNGREMLAGGPFGTFAEASSWSTTAAGVEAHEQNLAK